MGLDTVAIVLWAEKKYEIEIPDADAQDILTVGEFSQYIASKSLLLYESVLDNVIELLVNDYNISRDKISPESEFVRDLGLG